MKYPLMYCILLTLIACAEQPKTERETAILFDSTITYDAPAEQENQRIEKYTEAVTRSPLSKLEEPEPDLIEEPLIQNGLLKLPGYDTSIVIIDAPQNDFFNHRILDYQRGHLDLDSQIDLLLVLEHPYTDEYDEVCLGMEGAYCRIVVPLLNQGDNKYRIVGTGSQAIDCSLCGGAAVRDPYAGREVTISDGEIMISHLYGACQKTFIVEKYQFSSTLGNWVLYERVSDTYDCLPDPNSDTIEFETEIETLANLGEVLLIDQKY